MPTCSQCRQSTLDNDKHKDRFYLSTTSTVWDEADQFGDFLCSAECLYEFVHRILRRKLDLL